MGLNYKNIEFNDEFLKDGIKNRDDIFKIYEHFNNNNSEDIWIFRGESDYNWRLRTTFERVLIDRFINNQKCKTQNEIQEELEDILLNWKKYRNLKEKNIKNIIKFENNLLRDYQRKSRNIMDYQPDHKNWIEWLATMQHYGSPTRLLDWNYSIFIALYFSIEKAISDCSIYALKFNTCLFKEKITKKYGNKFYKFVEYSSKDTESLIKNKLTKNNNKKIVFPINAFYLNKRLTIQQGVFLITGNIKYSFEENLKNTFNEELKNNLYKIKINYTSKFRQEILYLLKKMNI